MFNEHPSVTERRALLLEYWQPFMRPS